MGTLQPVLHSTSSNLKVLLLYESPLTSTVLVLSYIKMKFKTVSSSEVCFKFKAKVDYLRQYLVHNKCYTVFILEAHEATVLGLKITFRGQTRKHVERFIMKYLNSAVIKIKVCVMWTSSIFEKNFQISKIP